LERLRLWQARGKGCREVTAKEYLARALLIDQRINSKLEQVQSLRLLAEKATSTLSQTPHGKERNMHRMEDVIVKMLDLESDINASIDALVDVKREIMEAVQCLQITEHRTLLELRYICGKTWEEIASTLFYSVRNVHILHSAALREFDMLREKIPVS
jgi:DNA-directed RNA polymerase specialized sigma24 family protein